MSRNQSIWVLESAIIQRKLFAAGAAGTLVVYDTESRAETYRRHISTGWINGLTYLESSRTLVASTSRGSLVLLDVDSLTEKVSITANYWFNAIKVVPSGDSQRCVVTSAEGSVFVWDIASGEFFEFPSKHTDQVWSCSVSENGTLATTCGGNGELGLWSISEKQFVSWIGRGGYTITSVAFLCKHGRLVSVDMGGLLTVWRLDDQHMQSRIVAHDARIWNIATSPNQQLFVTVGADRRVVLWDARDIRILHEVKLKNIPTSCTFLTNYIVAIGDRSGHVAFLDFDLECKRISDQSVSVGNPVIDKCGIVVFIDKSPNDFLEQYSKRLICALERSQLPYMIRYITGDLLLKQSLSHFSGCPLFPQLYLDNRFLGGSEVVAEMVEAGALQRLYHATRINSKAMPNCKL